MKMVVFLSLSLSCIGLLGNEPRSPEQTPRTINDRPTDRELRALGRTFNRRLEQETDRQRTTAATPTPAPRPAALIIARTFATDPSNTRNS